MWGSRSAFPAAAAVAGVGWSMCWCAGDSASRWTPAVELGRGAGCGAGELGAVQSRPGRAAPRRPPPPPLLPRPPPPRPRQAELARPGRGGRGRAGARGRRSRPATGPARRPAGAAAPVARAELGEGGLPGVVPRATAGQRHADHGGGDRRRRHAARGGLPLPGAPPRRLRRVHRLREPGVPEQRRALRHDRPGARPPRACRCWPA